MSEQVMYQAVIGLEVHTELATRSKMFCACAVVDTTLTPPNTAVCPVCLGLPGALPVLNRKAVELGLRVALGLGCEIPRESIFARKNYFYPDLPKGYQISQYEQPLGINGQIPILTREGEKTVRIRRVHLEEDTGKLVHAGGGEEGASLIDLNRSGLALLEIVTEPDLHSAEEVGAYGRALQRLLRAVGASRADMEKGEMRIEPNISLHRPGEPLGTRVEIKNLNSFRALERATAYQISLQTSVLSGGGKVQQQTVGWDEAQQVTVAQRSKEEAHDYRYFPEPDLPVLVVDEAWLEDLRREQPELPWEKRKRYIRDHELIAAEADQLVDDPQMARFFEASAAALSQARPRMAATWLGGEVTAWLAEKGGGIPGLRITPRQFAALLDTAAAGQINLPTAKTVLISMLETGEDAQAIIAREGLAQTSDRDAIAGMVRTTLDENTAEVEKYRAGKTTVFNWLYGQVMRRSGGKANPAVVKEQLHRQLD